MSILSSEGEALQAIRQHVELEPADTAYKIKMMDLVKKPEAIWSGVTAAELIELLKLRLDQGRSSEEVERRVKQKVEEALAALAVDQTTAWATQLLAVTGLNKPAPDAGSLHAMLFAPPPHTLPVPPLTHAKLLADAVQNPALQNALVSRITLSTSCNTFAYKMQQVLESQNPAASASEQECILFMAPMTDGLLRDVANWAGVGRITSSRDQTDTSGYTAAKKRPDLMMYFANAAAAGPPELMLKKEYKSDQHAVQEALKECAEKMIGEWSVLVFGTRQWLLCAGTSGTLVQFAFVPRGEKAYHRIGPQMDLAQVEDRITYVGVMVNILRLAIITKTDTSSQLQLGRIPGTVKHGCSVFVHDGYVVKRVINFNQQPNCNHNIKELRQLYKFLGQKRLAGIVRSKDNKVTLTGEDRYTVSLIPLGHRKTPGNESELREALRLPLQALAVLHQSGWVLRDIRDSNFLCGEDGYFFSDLEGAGRANSSNGCTVSQDLLVEGKFPPVSDMRLIGKLFTGVPISPPAGGGPSFRELLCDGHYANAQSALADAWFSG